MHVQTRTFTKDVHVQAPVDAAWRALTDARALTYWFPVEARVEPGVGGSIWLSWGGGSEGSATITAWEPLRRFQWTEERGPIRLVIDFKLEPAREGTLVRLTQSGFGAGAEWDHEFHTTSGAWRYFMEHLKWFLEKHPGRSRDLIAFRDATPLSGTEAYDRLVRTLDDSGADMLIESRNTCQAGFTIAALNDAIVLVEIESAPPGARAGFWLSTYGLSKQALAQARTRYNVLYRTALTTT